MNEEPDIVKELREAEKLGLLYNMIKSAMDELRIPDHEIEKNSRDTSHIIESYESKTTDNDLISVEEKYRTIFENYAIAITLVDNKERIVSWNKYTEELLNMTQNELYLKPINTLYPKEEWQKIREENVRQKGIKYRMETKMIRKDHGSFDIELSLCVLKGKEGKTVGSVGIIKDITKLKETERELKISEERYRTIFENSAIAITLTDEKERIISWNKFTENLLGLNKNDLFMKPVKSLYPLEEWNKIRSENIRQKGLQYQLETKMVKKNNEIIDIDLSLSVLRNHEGKVYGSIGVFKDTTLRKKIEQEIKIKERAIDSSINAVAISDLEGNLTYVNSSFLQMWGYNQENEILGKNAVEFWWEKNKASDIIKQLFREGGCFAELIAKRKNGSLFDVQLSASIVKDENNKPLCLLASFIDISKRKETEERIRRSEEGFRIIFENINDTIVYLDNHGKIIDINNRVEDLCGYKRDEIIDKNFATIGVFRLKELPKMIKLFKDIIKNGKAINLFELELKHKNGNKIFVEVNTRFIKDNNKMKGMVIICRDITERKKADIKLKKVNEKLEIFNQKLEQKVKERTAEVEKLLQQKDEFIFHLSHDLRTPLTPLVAFLPLLEKREKDPKIKDNIKLLNNKVNTLRNLVEKTLKFETIYSSSEVLDLEDIHLKKEIDSCIKNQLFIYNKRNLKIENKIKENIIVKADKLYIWELFNNLLSNAIKNTPDKGFIIINSEKEKNFVKISVKDNGIGINKDQIDQIFEEFYKTDISRHDLDSSGLGLSICKQIVEKHGGRIWAESKGSGKGSTFYFTLKPSTK